MGSILKLIINKTIIACTVIIVILPIDKSYAKWIGPDVVLEGNWGNKDKEFAIQYQDTFDEFPSNIKIDKVGNIIISDKVNKRIVVYNKLGELISIITPQKIKVNYYWASFFDCDSNENVYTSNHDYKFQKYNFDNTYMAFRCQGKTSPLDRNNTFL